MHAGRSLSKSVYGQSHGSRTGYPRWRTVNWNLCRHRSGHQKAKQYIGTKTAQVPQDPTAHAYEPLAPTDIADAAVNAEPVGPAKTAQEAVKGAVALAKESGKVSNSQATRILQTPGAVEYLQQYIDITLPGTASGNRAAIKNAVMAIANTHGALDVDENRSTPDPVKDTDAWLDTIIPKAPQTEVISTSDSHTQNDPHMQEHVDAEDYRNNDSPIWRNVAYGDETQKAAITRQTHDQMVSDGAVVKISKSVTDSVNQSMPDLRTMKKKDRTPILKEAINRLKGNLRQFLTSISSQGFEFEVNGKILDARLYSTGINEVLEKVTKEKAGMLYSTEGIFRNARYLYSTPDYDGSQCISVELFLYPCADWGRYCRCQNRCERCCARYKSTSGKSDI